SPSAARSGFGAPAATPALLREIAARARAVPPTRTEAGDQSDFAPAVFLLLRSTCQRAFSSPPVTARSSPRERCLSCCSSPEIPRAPRSLSPSAASLSPSLFESNRRRLHWSARPRVGSSELPLQCRPCLRKASPIVSQDRHSSVAPVVVLQFRRSADQAIRR